MGKQTEEATTEEGYRNAKAGEEITVPVPEDWQDEAGKTETFTVKASCAEGKTEGQYPPGRWFCNTHPQTELKYNMVLHSHINSPSKQGQCVIVWICYEHGPEVP